MAIGSARLGLKSALYSEVGNDTQGIRLKQSLIDNKVSTKYFYLKKGEKTNYSVVLYFKGDRTILVHHEKRAYKFPKIEKSKWIYLTSMGTGSQKIFKPLLTYLKKTNAKLGFNPGTHQIKLGTKKILPIIKRSNVMFINTQETQKILNTKTNDFRKLTKGLYDLGTKIAVVTDGPNGAYCYDGNNYWYCPIYDVKILERTGCGDAFSTGFLSALANNKPVEQAMVWASLNSAGVVQQVGPQNGLIKLTTLKKILKANPQYKARKFTSSQVKTNKIYKPKKYKSF